MKGIHTLVLTMDSVKEALDDYVNGHLCQNHGVTVIEWLADNSYDPVNKTITVKFRPTSEIEAAAESSPSSATAEQT